MTRIAYIALAVITAAYFSYVFFYNHMRAYHGALCKGCCANLKNIGMAIDDYAKQNNGKYPDELQKLIPIYLDKIPKCPAGRYSKHSRYEYAHSTKPEAYTVYCRGDFHSPSCWHDYPRYSSIECRDGRLIL